MRESAILAAITANLRNLGARPIKYHGGPHSEAGVSDLLVCYHGCLFCIEAKRPTEKPTPKQAAFLAQMTAFGATCGTAATAEDAQEILRGHRSMPVIYDHRSRHWVPPGDYLGKYGPQ